MASIRLWTWASTLTMPPASCSVTAGTGCGGDRTREPEAAARSSGMALGAVVAAGQTSAAITFQSPGSFAYHCSIHPTMHGTIMVTAAATSPPTPALSQRPARALAAGGGSPLAPLTLWLGLLALILGLALL